MAAWLSVESYVQIPLEESYQATWRTCPEAMREAVEMGS
jgi:hypothetical protein